MPSCASTSPREEEQGSEWIYYADTLHLDIFWLKDASLDEPPTPCRPDEIAAEIVESLEAALARFKSVAQKLG
jgi:type I restriction enzyme M protein